MSGYTQLHLIRYASGFDSAHEQVVAEQQKEKDCQYADQNTFNEQFCEHTQGNPE
jgi:hypothetical protein